MYIQEEEWGAGKIEATNHSIIVTTKYGNLLLSLLLSESDIWEGAHNNTISSLDQENKNKGLNKIQLVTPTCSKESSIFKKKDIFKIMSNMVVMFDANLHLWVI